MKTNWSVFPSTGSATERFSRSCCRRRPVEVSRRSFLRGAAVAVGSSIAHLCRGDEPERANSSAVPVPGVPIIDMHQHCAYGKRPDDALPKHQQTLGIRTTVLLPAATSGGLGGWTNAGNEQVAVFARQRPKSYVTFANENVFRNEATKTIERWLNAGAIGIGELKDNVACDGPEIIRIAEVARAFDVPVLMHFQEGRFNNGYANFHRILDRFPTVNFIGHAHTVWAYIDRRYQPSMGYLPQGPVEAGGLTDRWLAEYPNYYADLSAAEGNNALKRDAEFATSFLTRHQDKLFFGSDCPDTTGVGPVCVGAVKLELLSRLCATAATRDKILFRNARKIIRFPRDTLD